MNMIALAMLASATLAVPPPTAHMVKIDHQGRSFDVSYQGNLRLETKQVGMAPPTRMSTERCNWSAELTIERAVTPSGSGNVVLRRNLPGGETISGSRAGNCRTARVAIERELGDRHAGVKAQLAAAAERDHPELLAELTASSQLAAN